jgi:hypothetical protein
VRPPVTAAKRSSADARLLERRVWDESTLPPKILFRRQAEPRGEVLCTRPRRKIRAALSQRASELGRAEAVDLGQIYAKNLLQRLARGEAQSIGLLCSMPGAREAVPVMADTLPSIPSGPPQSAQSLTLASRCHTARRVYSHVRFLTASKSLRIYCERIIAGHLGLRQHGEGDDQDFGMVEAQRQRSQRHGRSG